MASLTFFIVKGRDASGHCDTLVDYKYASGAVAGYDTITVYSGHFLRQGCSAGYQPLHEDNCGRCRWQQRLLYLDGFFGVIITAIAVILTAMSGSHLGDREVCDSNCNAYYCSTSCDGDKPPVGAFVAGIILLVLGLVMFFGAIWVTKQYSVKYVLSTKAAEILQSDKVMEKSPGVYWYKGKILTAIPPATV